MEAILTIKNLSKNYTDFSLKHINFELPKGTIMGFIGENGAGKTTTIKAILNLIHSDGEITIFGKDHVRDEKAIKQDIGVVFDESYFHDNLRIKDIDKIMANMHQNWDSPLFYKYCSTFGLPSDKRVKQFSKGMKMKLSIAAALSHHPKLLIMDEATSGLDPVVRDEILDIFLDFIQDEEHSILFSSHITSDIEKIADYVTFIHQGEIIFSQSKDELLMDSAIMKIGEHDFHEMDETDILSYRKNAFGYEVLVSNREKMKLKYPKAVFDPARLEDIMLFYVRGTSR